MDNNWIASKTAFVTGISEQSIDSFWLSSGGFCFFFFLDFNLPQLLRVRNSVTTLEKPSTVLNSVNDSKKVMKEMHKLFYDL